ncbi:hypothetical protein SAMN06265337_0775 [Hymenobacter gelipurpurascens]|uniref:Uncharacterized protein n=1 Tax=Hymenobacter gelipurpurascens TaxID=89968 RepID=A0A212TA79_9BACT|nr:hypothetical protein [Hymenobacter gelipurpurascens]SNC62953.1 hypothetical protein SAMN06265337_0775 [Hymenobacter gelipurpurascens]
MPADSTEGRWRLAWFFALGTGWVSVLILVVDYWMLGKPEWLGILDGSKGWTVYPPLMALPQAIPGVQTYNAVLLSATIAGLILFVTWFLALKQWPRGSKRPSRWFWLSLLLLAPVSVSVGGTLYSIKLKRVMEMHMLQEFSERPEQESSNGSAHINSQEDVLDKEK